MPYPKKYRDPYTTSVRLERTLKNMAERMNPPIELSTALAFGLSFMIDDRLLNSKTPPKIPPELLAEYIALKEQEHQEIVAYLNLAEKGAKKLEAAREEAVARDKQEKQILLVHDSDTESRKVIYARDFREDIHELIRPATDVDLATYGQPQRVWAGG